MSTVSRTAAIRDARNIDRYRGPDGRIWAQPMRYAELQSDFGAFVRSLGITAGPAAAARQERP